MSLFESHSIPIQIPPGCPWHEAQVHFGTPNVDWCEPTRCALITEPLNTWSNLAFLVAGLWILLRFRHVAIRGFAWIVIVMGLFSAIYHATNNALSQYLDFFGMILMMSALLALLTIRLWYSSEVILKRSFLFFILLNLVVLWALYVAQVPIQSLILINMLPIVIGEVCYILFYNKISLGWRSWVFLVLSVVVLILAQVFAQLDLKRIYCDPEGYLHGHVLWHIFCALGMVTTSYHLEQHLPKKI